MVSRCRWPPESESEVGLGRVWWGEQQIGTDGRVEDMRFLARQREPCADVFLPVLMEIAAVHGHPSLGGVEEAEQEVRHRRLPGTARSDERDVATRLETQVEVRDDRRRG